MIRKISNAKKNDLKSTHLNHTEDSNEHQSQFSHFYFCFILFLFFFIVLTQKKTNVAEMMFTKSQLNLNWAKRTDLLAL